MIIQEFYAEWVVNNAKCNREENDNKNKRLLKLVRKRRNTLPYQPFEMFIGFLQSSVMISF